MRRLSEIYTQPNEIEAFIQKSRGTKQNNPSYQEWITEFEFSSRFNQSIMKEVTLQDANNNIRNFHVTSIESFTRKNTRCVGKFARVEVIRKYFSGSFLVPTT